MTTYIFLFLSTIGFLDSAFLTQEHYTRNPLVCPIFGGCDKVTNSAYSEIFGIPLALLGVIFYSTILGLSLYSYLRDNQKILEIASKITIAGFLASAIFVYLQIFIIKAICFYCMLSALSSTLLFITAMTYLKHRGKLDFINSNLYSRISQVWKKTKI